MDWDWRWRRRRGGGSRGHSESRLTHRDCWVEGSLLSCVWLFLGLHISLFTSSREVPHTYTHTYIYDHTCRLWGRLLRQVPRNGHRKASICFGTELFNLWLIIIWPYKGRGWGNSSAGLDCNLLCFSFPWRPTSGRSRALTGVLDACMSYVDPYCRGCCITWTKWVQPVDWSKAQT